MKIIRTAYLLTIVSSLIFLVGCGASSDESAPTNNATVTCQDCALGVQVKLSWDATPQAGMVSKYEVYFAKSANSTDASSLLKTILVSDDTFDPASPSMDFDAGSDLSLNKGDDVCFRLKALNSIGSSDFSKGICTQVTSQ